MPKTINPHVLAKLWRGDINNLLAWAIKNHPRIQEQYIKDAQERIDAK